MQSKSSGIRNAFPRRSIRDVTGVFLLVTPRPARTACGAHALGEHQRFGRKHLEFNIRFSTNLSS
jgi:hypothetical protein